LLSNIDYKLPETFGLIELKKPSFDVNAAHRQSVTELLLAKEGVNPQIDPILLLTDLNSQIKIFELDTTERTVTVTTFKDLESGILTFARSISDRVRNYEARLLQASHNRYYRGRSYITSTEERELAMDAESHNHSGLNRLRRHLMYHPMFQNIDSGESSVIPYIS
jgi:hypothetical protein